MRQARSIRTRHGLLPKGIAHAPSPIPYNPTLAGSALGLTIVREGDVDESRKRVECRHHGIRDATYVCQHLVSETGAGFHLGGDEEDPDQLWPDAWCDACERVLQAEGEWNDRATAFARIRLLCDACYRLSRERNWKQDDEAFDTLVRDAIDYFQIRQDELSVRYKLLEYSRYDWSQDGSQLTFSSNGQARLVADIQFVGSVSTRSDTWLWSWANRSIVEPARRRVRDVRAYGETHHFLKLACAAWEADEDDGWTMTAVTAYLLKAPGGYRTADERGATFMVMTDLYWAQ